MTAAIAALRRFAATAKAKMAERAAAAGGLAFLGYLQHTGSWDGAAIRGGLVAGGLALLEYFTPNNPDVGPRPKP